MKILLNTSLFFGAFEQKGFWQTKLFAKGGRLVQARIVGPQDMNVGKI
jgi:hypothetical protein